MAKYWAKLSTGYWSEKVDQVSLLDNIPELSGAFYAQGVDIDFEMFFSIKNWKRAECIVYESNLQECTLHSNDHITGFDNQIIFEKCTIDKFKITDLTFKAFSLTNCSINEITIEQCRGIQTLHFGVNSDIKEVQITNSNIGHLHITDIKSINNIQINQGIVRSILLNNSKFTILSCTFFGILNKIEINNSEFKSIKFSNITIGQELCLSKCPKGKVTFDLCEIQSKEINIEDSNLDIKLHKVRSYEKILIRINQSKLSKILLDRCYFQDEVLFQGQIAQKEKNLIIKDTVFKELVLFDDDNARCIEISETLFQKGLLLPIPQDINTNSIHSTVWCILKKQAISRNDNINAFHYRKNELNSYITELKNKKIISQERFVLFLNKISNNHGISWIRGVWFTLLSWIIFYSLFKLAEDDFYCLTHNDCTIALFQKNFLSSAIDYLWIPQGLKDLSAGLINDHVWWVSTLMILTFILGKILIAYGLFQTISAFRRHGKM